MRKGWAIGLGVVAVLAIGGFLGFQRYWYYLPGIIGNIKNPVQPYHDVAWAEGPAVPAAPADQRPPNVIFVLADDLGYNDITLNGGGVDGGAVPTPNIDSIAHDGVDFTNGYAGNATCAPSRAAIMTGRYATRFGFEFTPTPVAFERLIAKMGFGGPKPPIWHGEDVDAEPEMEAMIVPTDQIMIPKLLKTKDYHTIFLGKWHLGETDGARPDQRGFDEALGFLAGASRYGRAGDPNVEDSVQDFDPIDKFLWANLRFAVTWNGSKPFYPNEYMTDYLGDNAVTAIHANRGRPFFMYLAFNAPHTPLQALRSDYDALAQIKDHRLRVYGAMVRALDRNVGKVLEELKREGLDKNTLVIFTSDNGGANYIGLPNINKPYRGWKMTFFEGGIHVPYFMRWPAKIPPGTTYAFPVAHTDIFATAAAAAGAAMPSDRVMDGVNLVSYLDGENKGVPHRTLFWRSGHYMTLLDGAWKLQVDGTQKKIWLFDLKADPTEKTNLAATMQDQVKAEEAVMNKINAQQHKPLWPSLIEGPINVDTALSYPPKPGDDYVYWAN